MKPRKPLKITSRSSTVTNAFVQAIIPYIEFTPAEFDEALAVLGQSAEDPRSVYCGDSATDLDHLRPLVRDKRPTGYITEIRNLVPACGPCNQSKSGSDWRTWIVGSALNSPESRGVTDLDQRIEKLDAFVAWARIEPLDFSRILDTASYRQYWQKLEEIHDQMRQAQGLADALQRQIAAARA